MYSKGIVPLLAAVAACSFAPISSPAEETPPVQTAAYTEEAVLFREIPSVYGASKYDQKITEAPSSVSIVTADEIRKYGYRTLADILRSVRGFYVTYDRNYSYVGVRGFGRPADYNTRILLLIDGHRTNDNVYDGAYVGTEAVIDVDLIDRVEIIRGPGSSLYGSNAFFAVVNVITRQGRAVRGVEFSGEAGSFGTYGGRISYGDRLPGNSEIILSGSALDSKGQDLFYPGLGTASHADYDRFGRGFLKYSIRDFTVTGAYSSRTKGIPTGAFGTDFGDTGNRTVDKRGFLDLNYRRGVGSQTELTARGYYDYYEYLGDYIYGGVVQKDRGYGAWCGGELKAVTTTLESQRIIGGVEFQANLRQDQENYDVGALPPPNLDDRRRTNVWAAYLQDEAAVATGVLLNAGVRYDHYETFGGTTNPRIALIYDFAESGTLKFLYGRAFRTPNAFELYFASPGFNQPNPDLRPETINTYTISYERSLGETVRVTAAGYMYDIHDLISQRDATPLPGTIFMNVDEVKAHGAEFEIEAKQRNGLEGRLSYSIQRAEDRLSGQPLTNSPAHLLKLNIAIPTANDGLVVGFEEQYMSRRRTEAGGETGGISLTNLTLQSRRLLPRLEAYVGIYNLFNKEYSDPVSADFSQDAIPQDGRNYRVKLVYAF